MMKRMILVTAAVVMMAGVAFGQYNPYSGRSSALGDPHLGGYQNVNLIDDVSDVVTFPSDVAVHSDMVQGYAGNNSALTSVNGYAYGSKKIMDMFSVGLIFNSTTYSNFAIGTYPSFSYTALVSAVPSGLTSASANQILWAGAFSVPAAAVDFAPGSVAHFVAAIPLGSLNIGLDLFREASNSSWTTKDVVNTPVVTPITSDHRNSEGFSNFGAKGFGIGAGLNVGNAISLKLSTGYTLLSYSAENKQTGTRTIVATGVTTTYNTETSNIDATTGYYMPIHLKVGLEMGIHKFCVGVAFEKSAQQFEAKFNDGDDAIAALTPVKSDLYSLTNMAVGIADRIQIFENTIMVPSVSMYRIACTNKPENADNANPEVTTTDYGFPVTSLGFERDIKNVWKFDDILVRAGGSKDVTWQAIDSKGTDATSEASGPQNGGKFNWMLGLGLVMNNLCLDMTINPATLNGIYFISGNDGTATNGGTGPRGANVTLTYRFGGESSNIPGMAPSPAMQ
ncbi:MAG: hypothetical protein V1913_18535 [Fibrobacterota bacterium]